MKKVVTDDGSVTFHNEKYGETYHSTSGAVEESLKKFVEPCDVAQFAKKGEVCILDVCFGLGYNAGVAIDVALRENPDCKIIVVGLEIDPDVLGKIVGGEGIGEGIACYDMIKKLVGGESWVDGTGDIRKFSSGDVELVLYVGDARESVKKLVGKYLFDVVFLDPFSPKKCPELWCEEFLKNISTVVKKDGRLGTYSYARVVRDNLERVGFSVSAGPRVGRRCPSTIAVKK